MRMPRIPTSRRTIGLVVAVPLAVGATWGGIALAAGPAKADRSQPVQTKLLRQQQQQQPQQKLRGYSHDGRQCPFREGEAAAAEL